MDTCLYISQLPQMEPIASQVRNHYSQKNQEAHLVRALAFKMTANVDWRSNVSISNPAFE